MLFHYDHVRKQQCSSVWTRINPVLLLTLYLMRIHAACLLVSLLLVLCVGGITKCRLDDTRCDVRVATRGGVRSLSLQDGERRLFLPMDESLFRTSVHESSRTESFVCPLWEFVCHQSSSVMLESCSTCCVDCRIWQRYLLSWIRDWTGVKLCATVKKQTLGTYG